MLQRAYHWPSQAIKQNKKKIILHFVHSKITEVTSKFSEFRLIFVTTVHDQQGNIACIYIEKWGGGGWKQTGTVLPTVTFAASARLQLLTSSFYTVDAIVTVWFTVQKKTKILKNYWEFFKSSSKVELVIIVSLINHNQHKFYRR